MPSKDHLDEDLTIQLVVVGLQPAVSHQLPHLRPLSFDVVRVDGELKTIDNGFVRKLGLVVDRFVEVDLVKGLVMSLPFVSDEDRPLLNLVFNERDEEGGVSLVGQKKCAPAFSGVVAVAFDEADNPNVIGCRLVAFVVFGGEQFALVAFDHLAWASKLELAPFVHSLERKVDHVLHFAAVTCPRVMGHPGLRQQRFDQAAS